MTQPLTPAERETLLLELVEQLLTSKTTPGAVLKKLRREVLGMNQTDYAALASISRRTLSDIETDKGSPSLALLNRAFRPFGLTVGLLPRSPALRQRLLNREQSV
ncbi:helix-turn-helix transcriptional regulator [Larsenimonas salina]|uniref:helix-turn-helix transcriptional regulator n=1 Tax=Larsenimonas salina TaxID=1295565 RepID=UPI002073B54A|nr:helix-turn-helix transcriptional regulator [Larsenimonas salina]MCM5705058.1 helix-turn-helix domain-containing protein [Larsenimonas salina]